MEMIGKSLNLVNNATIVVFGFDNTGKSTLCDALVSNIYRNIPDSITYLHHSPGPIPVHEQMEWLEKNLTYIKGGSELQNYRNVTVMDRFPIISEFVYGNVLRNKNNFLNHEDFRTWAFSIPLLFIYCRPPVQNILTWGEREQYSGVKEKANECIALYDQVLDRFPEIISKTIIYDYTRDNMERFCTEVTNRVWQFFKTKEEIVRKRRNLG